MLPVGYELNMYILLKRNLVFVCITDNYRDNLEYYTFTKF
jgi:hypothetical protein